MLWVEIVFWVCLAFVGYTFAGYPLCLAVVARLRPKPIRRGEFHGCISVIVAARNEETAIGARIEELCRQVRRAGVHGEIIVVSDGSTDRTADIARRHECNGPVRVLELADNVGKAAALSRACRMAAGDVLVFADTRQRWADDALPNLLANFADPTVGAVSGDLVLEDAPGVLTGVGLYWRLEKWLRKTESLVHAQIGVTGAISAVRRVLFRPIPAGTILDDVYWPLDVALQGYRVVHDERAQAFDRLPDNAGDEFRRKVRTLAGNYQLVARLPQALLPWRNPVWWSWLSHKLMRLAAPWALLAVLACNIVLTGPVYRPILAAQLYLYGLALFGLMLRCGPSARLIGVASSFVVLNAAAWLAFWVWVTGRAGRSWTKARYQLKPMNVELTTTLQTAAREPRTATAATSR
ncbi:MAG: glycosyltransferase family 2 protein [Gemmataceae bacterium]|nr:glycosyltransferase family 2 protein [Gemmataceae bacterium]